MLFLETGNGLTLADTLRANGTKILVTQNANPEVNDWNEDGKKDLIVGEQFYGPPPDTGNIRVYLNVGTNSNPIFSKYFNIYSSGKPIYHYRANPRIYDLDQDGKKDLIVGQNDGRVYFYKNVGTNANPQFNGYELLRTIDNTIIDVYYGSRFHLADWKEDGDPDLIISGYYGYIIYYENATVEVEEGSSPLLDCTIWPNPIQDQLNLNIELNGSEDVSIGIYGVDGRLVSTPIRGRFAQGFHRFRIDVSNLTSGVYFIEVATEKRRVRDKILIVD